MKTIRAVIEIPHGARYKYEIDKVTGNLTIDRPLPAFLPYNYGYIENTLYKDGDPLDVCVIGQFPIAPLTRVDVVPIGIFMCNDNGESDEKVVAYVKGENHDKCFVDEALRQIAYYLATYKDGFHVLSYENADIALEIHDWSIENAKTS